MKYIDPSGHKPATPQTYGSSVNSAAKPKSDADGVRFTVTVVDENGKEKKAKAYFDDDGNLRLVKGKLVAGTTVTYKDKSYYVVDEKGATHGVLIEGDDKQPRKATVNIDGKDKQVDIVNGNFYEKGVYVGEATESGRNYSNALVEFVKQNEGCYLTPGNGGQTIGWGFDYKTRPDIKINWNDDGSITQKEADRLLNLILDEHRDNLNKYLDDNGLVLDQNAFDAAMDLFYNRNSNALTKEVVSAMAAKDDKTVQRLLSDFDYRYALRYIYIDDTAKSKAFVDRNPGLKTRRSMDFEIYKYGFK